MPDRRVRRSEEGQRVTVEVSPEIAAMLAKLKKKDLLLVLNASSPYRRIASHLQTLLLLFLVAAAVYIWGPWWDWRQTIYDTALSKCEVMLKSGVDSSHLNLIVDEGGIAQTCLDLTDPLKPPPSDPMSRLEQVYEWVSTPVINLAEDIFIPDHTKNTNTRNGGTVGSVDYSSEVRENSNNPTLRAVVQEAIRLQSEFSVPWRYVVDACYYESSGLNQYNGNGELVQGRNLNTDGSLSSTDWGMCQINDYWHPDLMGLAKGDWKTNLRAGFTVMNGSWSSAQTIGDGEYRLRFLWGKYNGSGPYDLYANRVWDAHNLLEPRIGDILRSFESPPQITETSPFSVSPGAATEVINLDRDVPVYDGQSANIRTWALNNPSFTVPAGGQWSFCAQTNKTGWGSFSMAAGINAGGICANATQIDKVARQTPGLQVVAITAHTGSDPFYTVAINCPGMDYVIKNTSGTDIEFNSVISGNQLQVEAHQK